VNTRDTDAVEALHPDGVVMQQTRTPRKDSAATLTETNRVNRPPAANTNNRAPIIVWSKEEAGATFEGAFVGQRAGRYGPLYDLDTKNGRITLPATSVLGKKLERVKAGDVIVVVYDGLQTPKRPDGKPYHAFTVFEAAL